MNLKEENELIAILKQMQIAINQEYPDKIDVFAALKLTDLVDKAFLTIEKSRGIQRIIKDISKPKL